MDIGKVEAAFNAACIAVKTLPTKPSDDELLVLYGLYKQELNIIVILKNQDFLNLKTIKNGRRGKVWKL